MISLDQNRMILNQTGLEMFGLCGGQLKSTREAFFEFNHDLAEKVIHVEKKLNAMDIKLDRDCERFLALHQPVAQDLRFVLGLRKINFGLERIGDYCFGISKYISEMKKLPNTEILMDLRLQEMFDHAIFMFDVVLEVFENGNSAEVRKIFKKEQKLNEINRRATSIISSKVKKSPNLIDQYLVVFSISKKLERIGDLITNMAEEIIFYYDAEVWRHQDEKFEWD